MKTATLVTISIFDLLISFTEYVLYINFQQLNDSISDLLVSFTEYVLYITFQTTKRFIQEIPNLIELIKVNSVPIFVLIGNLIKRTSGVSISSTNQ